MEIQHPAAGTFRFGVFELDARREIYAVTARESVFPISRSDSAVAAVAARDVVTRDELRHALLDVGDIRRLR
jgi:hypothetical protein